jgi:beta-lactamase regulating signal transducer with metallopeptidase domain
MIASAMTYSSIGALLTVPIGLALERAMVASRKPRRVAWLLSVLASLIISLTAALAVRKHEWPVVDAIATVLWPMVSIALAAISAASFARLNSVLHRWTVTTVDATRVRISDNFGPRVVGFLKPEIIVPAWLCEADCRTRTAILSHELQHIERGDHLLFFMELVLRSLVPWNLPLQWQLHRLRLAIEADCDSRVLRLGLVDRFTYVRSLVSTSQRSRLACRSAEKQLAARLRILTASSDVAAHSCPGAFWTGRRSAR